MRRPPGPSFLFLLLPSLVAPSARADDPAPGTLDAAWVAMPLPTLAFASCATEFDGHLYIGGPFTAVGTLHSPHVVSWDGGQFSAVADPGFPVLSLIVWRGSLWAGGGEGG